MRAVLPKPGVTPVAMPSPYAAAQGDFTPVIDQVLEFEDCLAALEAATADKEMT